MKKLMIGVMFAALVVMAGPVQKSLVWDDPNPAGSVAYYTVYSLNGGATNELRKVQTAQWPIVLPVGEHMIAVTATGINGLESEMSTNMTFRILIMQRNLRIE